jgi:hypothetical protein
MLAGQPISRSHSRQTKRLPGRGGMISWNKSHSTTWGNGGMRRNALGVNHANHSLVDLLKYWVKALSVNLVMVISSSSARCLTLR